MKRLFFLSIILFFPIVSGATGDVTDPSSSAKCKVLIENEINKGASAFTISMIERMASILVEQGKFTTQESAKRCVKFQLIQHKIPFEE